jgi:hypothetical protein
MSKGTLNNFGSDIKQVYNGKEVANVGLQVEICAAQSGYTPAQGTQEEGGRSRSMNQSWKHYAENPYALRFAKYYNLHKGRTSPRNH